MYRTLKIFHTLSSVGLHARIERCVSSAVTRGNINFECVMINNIGAKSSSVEPYFIRYCAFNEIVPNLKPSNRKFEEVEDES